MRHIILSLTVLLTATSCATLSRITSGDITLMNYNGEVLREYKNATIREETLLAGSKVYDFGGIKMGGSLNFSDTNGTHLISGGIIIVDNINMSESSKDSGYKRILSEDRDVLKEEKTYFSKLIESTSREMEDLDKGSAEYKGKQDYINLLRSEISKIDRYLSTGYMPK